MFKRIVAPSLAKAFVLMFMTPSLFGATFIQNPSFESNFNPTFYYFRNVRVTSAVDTADLEFATVAAGDATIVLDAVCVVPCEPESVVVMNPSFEASGNLPLPGLIPAGQNLAGWTLGGAATVGVNASGEGFADNGVPRDQDHVVFLQGASSISQVLNGLIPGTNYELSFAYNQ